MSAALGLVEVLVHSNSDLQKSSCTKQWGPLRFSSKERARWTQGGLSKRGRGTHMWGDVHMCVYVHTWEHTRPEEKVRCPAFPVSTLFPLSQGLSLNFEPAW